MQRLESIIVLLNVINFYIDFIVFTLFKEFLWNYFIAIGSENTVELDEAQPI